MKVQPLIRWMVIGSLVIVSRAFAKTEGRETKVMIRAIAGDAKVIGEHVARPGRRLR
jgi:hypothetical protein